MKFEEALVALREGSGIRRSEGDVRWIRLVDPREELGVDGLPDEIHIVHSGTRVSGPPVFSDMEEAKKWLTTRRRDHTNAWKEYLDYTEEVESAAWAVSQKLQQAPVAKPVQPRDYWKECEAVVKPVPRTRRCNRPYLIVLRRNGNITPWCPQPEDILATDWKRA